MAYELMYKDVVILAFDGKNPNDYEVLNSHLLPMGIKNGMRLESWLHQRRADSSRVSIRKLFATLKMNFGNDAYISQYRKPTDFYWIRKQGSDDTFDMEIEDLHQISLNLSSVVPTSPRNYEVANIGSYDKGWRHPQGQALMKRGNKNEVLSEILYAKVSEQYIHTAQYLLGFTKDDGFLTISPNFVHLEADEFLVLADEWTGTGADEDFEGWFKNFEHTLTTAEKEVFAMMHFLDVVMNNFDRHCQNFGFIYKEDGSRFVAPNFDFNLSIIGYNGIENLGTNEMSLETYFDVFEMIPCDVKTLPDISAQFLTAICKDVGFDEKAPVLIWDWIITRWKALLELEKDRT